jgi:uncharacterized protein (TIGR02145 family)
MRGFGRHGWGRALLFTAMVVVGAVCVSYGDNPSALVGQWVDMKNGDNVELFKDGTGAVDGENITWKTEGKRFMLSSGNKSKIGDYNLSGYELTRTFDGDEVIVWVRKDKLKEYIEKISSYFTDSRDGQKYRAVKIGGKMWMAQNLNHRIGRSGCYDASNSNCEKYGRLYDWNTAKTACPSGWHLPSLEEWGALAIAAVGGGTYNPGYVLKSASGWDFIGNGIDGKGFSALPGGNRYYDGNFYSAGKSGYWWTATDSTSDLAYSWSMYDDGDGVGWGGDNKSNGFSVRCVKND